MRTFTLRLCLLSALSALLAIAPGAWAQTPRELIAADADLGAGIYHSYDYAPGPEVPAPEGYEPFYISHYGRHGSRWHTSQELYTSPLETLRKAGVAGLLTPQGRDLLARAEVIAADADGRWGALTPRGVSEHRAIAGRMFAAWPEVFATDSGRVCRIESRSTLVPRCILSMAAFNERLKELNPEIRITREAGERYDAYLANGPGMGAQHQAVRAVADSLCGVRLAPDRLMAALFSDPQAVVASTQEAQRLMRSLYLLAAIVQDVDYLGISLWDLFTDEERYALWECENAHRYMGMGPSLRFGDPAFTDAAPLLRNIVETAQRVVDGEDDLSASLRFGHDVFITPLAALIGVKGASARVFAADEIAGAWNVGLVSPMAANLQLIFFRDRESGDVRVRVLYNERDAQLPVEGGPYYPWTTLKAYFENLYQYK